MRYLKMTALFVVIILVAGTVSVKAIRKGIYDEGMQTLTILKESVDANNYPVDQQVKVKAFLSKYRSDFYTSALDKFADDEYVMIDMIWLASIDCNTYFELTQRKYDSDKEKMNTKEFSKKEITKIYEQYKNKASQ